MADEQLRFAAHSGQTAEVTQLLASGADPNGHRDEVRAGRPRAPAAPMPAVLTTRATPPLRPAATAPAAARRHSLTRRVRRAAAPPGRMAAPPL